MVRYGPATALGESGDRSEERRASARNVYWLRWRQRASTGWRQINVAWNVAASTPRAILTPSAFLAAGQALHSTTTLGLDTFFHLSNGDMLEYHSSSLTPFF